MKAFLEKYVTRPHPLIVFFILALSLGTLVYLAFSYRERPLSEEQIFSARVERVLLSETHEPDQFRRGTVEQELLVEVELDGQRVQKTAVNDLVPVRRDDRVYVQASSLGEQDESFYVTDVARRAGLWWLAAFFALLVLVTSGKKGARALVGLVFSFAVIFAMLIPAVLGGFNPIGSGLVCATLILLVGFYVSYGINRKSVSALAGIFLSLVFVALLARFTVVALHFSGFTGEETVFLHIQTGMSVDLIGILIAGIIIAAIGVLDDVAITQASIVSDLTGDGVHGWELFKRAMKVGQDHMSAMVNTLVLAYTGAAMPLLLLLAVDQRPVGFVVNHEIIAEEIVRTLISSSGLLLAVPLTTAIAVFLYRERM